MSPTVVPFGEWTSPITPESFTQRSVALSQVRIDGGDTYWVESHPQEHGRNVLLCRNGLGQTTEVLPMLDGFRLVDVDTHVNEYGGRAYAVLDGIIVFSDGVDGRVYRYDTRNPRRELVPLTPLANVRYGDFEIDDVRGIVYAIREDHRVEGEPVTTLASIPLDGLASRDESQIQILWTDSDFVAAPSVSPDGTKLAFLTWNHPEMPWTQSALHVASLGVTGELGLIHTLIDSPEICVYEPRWTLDGDLVHVDDSTGWANLYRTEGFVGDPKADRADTADAAPAPVTPATPGAADTAPDDTWVDRLRTRPLHPGPRAFSHPHWQLGLHTFDNLDHDHLICSWSEDHTWHLGSVDLRNGLMEEWSTGWWPIGNVASAGGRVVFLGDSATETAAVVQVRSGTTTTIRPSTDFEIPADLISSAELTRWATRDGEEAYGFYYPPRNPDAQGPSGELPPLIVNVHDGPTASARPGLSLPVQFWTSRGIAVLDVNYRGSTGAGRAYRERLNGHWGEMDVADCADGAIDLIQRGLVDPKRVAIRGYSAGGFTALMALAQTDVFSGGVSVAGITDLRTISDETHKFESRYFERLIGTDDPSNPLWDERSPLAHAGAIKAPVLLLHGEDDAVVPVRQARAMAEEISVSGSEVILRVFPGEGHRFRRAETILRGHELELGFYETIWGLAHSEDA